MQDLLKCFLYLKWLSLSVSDSPRELGPARGDILDLVLTSCFGKELHPHT